MNLDQLRYADTVGKLGSFSAAARELGLSQPALSTAVARFEQELGVEVFTRSTRGVVATEHGQRVLPMVAAVLDRVQDLMATSRALAGGQTAALRLGVSPLIGGDLIATAFDAARELTDPRDLVLREADLDVLHHSLLEGRLDLLLVPAARPMPRLQHRVISREPVVVVNTADDRRGEPLEVADMAQASYILVPDTCGLAAFTTALFRDAQLPLRTYAGEASSYRVVDEWAGLGIGAAVLPTSKTTPGAASRPLVRHGQPVEITYEGVWDSAAATTPLVEEFLNLLVDHSRP